MPDLAFSEVKFLNQCRSEQLPIKQFYHNKRRALLDLKNEDISRFFSATGLEKPAISARSRKKTKISRSMGVSKMNGSILHDEPLFLGFGQHIPRNSFSPMKITASTPVKPIDSDQQNRSQFTWSQSPATTRTEVRRSGSTGKVLKNLPRSIEPDSEKENQIPDRVADSSELMRKLHAHIDEQTTKALSRDTSAGFIDELSELVDKWKDRREPRCPNKQSISFSQPLNQTNTQPVQPSISNTENDRQKLVHEVEDNTRCDYEKFGTKGVTIPHEDYQIASPIQDHVTTRPSELLPQRIPSAGDINGFPCHQPSAKNTTVLSIPLASIFEQQSKSDAAISCSKEFGVDIPGREATSRSSLPYSPHADPRSVIMLQTFDGLSQDLGEYYPNPCNRPYSQGKTPNTDQWTDLQQSRSPFIQTNSSTSRNHGRPYSRLSTVSNIPTENFEFATPNQRQTASSMTSCSRVPHGAHYRLLQDQETPAYARRIQQQVVGRNTVPSDRLEPENFWTPQKLY